MVASMALIAFVVFIQCVLALIVVGLSYWSSFFAYLNVVNMGLMLSFIVFAIPLKLNWSRNLYSNVFWGVVIYCLFCVSVYAGHYYFGGLVGPEGTSAGLIDCLYFSLTMWTDLGYGVFTPSPHLRMLSVLEAINGLLTLPVLGAVIWLYCTFRIRDEPKTTHGREFSRILRDGQIGLDMDRGVGVEQPTEKRRRAEAKRTASYALNDCAKCSSKNLTIPRFWELPGARMPLWFYAYPFYIVQCVDCGNVSDESRNVYRAVRSWNTLNQPNAATAESGLDKST